MKTVEYYMSLPYKMEIIPDTEENGFVVRFPELPGCMTCVEKSEDIIGIAEDCKRAWLMASLEDGIEIPEPSGAEEYSGQFKLRLPKSLHKSLAEHSKEEGISMNQYCLYLLSKNDAARKRE